VAARDREAEAGAGVRVLFASSNEGKLREYRELALSSSIELDSVPNFGAIPQFEESAPTFAENSVGKALHYSRFTPELVMADDSGLVVPALGGAPGVHSARYAGVNATSQDRVRKLLREMEGLSDNDRRAHFVCVIALARRGSAFAVISDLVEGRITTEPRGTSGFGYDPVFLIPDLGRTFAEISQEEKNSYSHRGKAFRKAFRFLGLPKNILTRL
jgi:XTP/dITP diphosphohydrolase